MSIGCATRSVNRGCFHNMMHMAPWLRHPLRADRTPVRGQNLDRIFVKPRNSFLTCPAEHQQAV